MDTRARLAIEYLPLAELRPYAANARTHSQHQIEQIAASLREFGWTNPVLVDAAGGIVAGHGRVRAAELVGAVEVPVVRVAGLTPDQVRAYVIADNQLALNAGWDRQLLTAELELLKQAGFDLEVLGFGAVALHELLGDADDADVDTAPPVPIRPVSQLGDLWLMGDHRLVVGDSTLPETYALLLPDRERADVCWTDPPYNVAYAGAAGSIANDDMGDAEFLHFLTQALSCVAAVLRPGAPIYAAHADVETVNLRKAFAAAGLKYAQGLVWVKDHATMGRSDYQWAHEPIGYGWKPGARHAWFGGRRTSTVHDLTGLEAVTERVDDKTVRLIIGGRVLLLRGAVTFEEDQGSVIREPRPTRSPEHPTMKPVALVERFLRNSGKKAAVVLEPFGGSGTTLIAAQRLGMRARVIELSPNYADVIVRRWQTLTGAQAVHADGEYFDERAAAALVS